MSRVIRMRAWSPENQKMYEVNVFNCNWNKGQIVIKKSDTLMQFTGLLDKNGVEVFEGDIIKDDNTTFEVEWYLAKWHFKRITGAYQYPNESARAVFMEVVGNIHQHPHLLEGGKNG